MTPKCESGARGTANVRSCNIRRQNQISDPKVVGSRIAEGMIRDLKNDFKEVKPAQPDPKR